MFLCLCGAGATFVPCKGEAALLHHSVSKYQRDEYLFTVKSLTATTSGASREVTDYPVSYVIPPPENVFTREVMFELRMTTCASGLKR